MLFALLAVAMAQAPCDVVDQTRALTHDQVFACLDTLKFTQEEVTAIVDNVKATLESYVFLDILKNPLNLLRTQTIIVVSTSWHGWMQLRRKKNLSLS